MKKKSIALSIITVLCIIATVALWFAMNNEKLEYEEVKATVLTSESGHRRVAGKSQLYYKVEVEYAGKTYDLKNLHSNSPYIPGREVTVYSANGKLYANEEGVKTATPVATVYFVFLFGSFGLLIYTLTYISKTHQKSKQSQ